MRYKFLKSITGINFAFEDVLAGVTQSCEFETSCDISEQAGNTGERDLSRVQDFQDSNAGASMNCDEAATDVRAARCVERHSFDR